MSDTLGVDRVKFSQFHFSLKSPTARIRKRIVMGLVDTSNPKPTVNRAKCSKGWTWECEDP